MSVHHIVTHVHLRSLHPLDENWSFLEVKVELYEIIHSWRFLPVKLFRKSTPEGMRIRQGEFIVLLVRLYIRNVSFLLETGSWMENGFLGCWEGRRYAPGSSLKAQGKLQVAELHVTSDEDPTVVRSRLNELEMGKGVL